MSKNLETQWIKYTNWLKSVSPHQFALLNEGANDEEIETLKKTFDFELPDELLELYRLNNGQKDYPYQGSAFFSLTFLSIDNLIINYRMWKGLFYEKMSDTETFGSYPEYEKEGGESFPIKAIKIKYINLKWIPIWHDGGGNHIGIDLDPDVNGTYGQVINFGRDENKKFVMANSLAEFFAVINEQIKLGNVKMLKASENGFGEDANFYLMSFSNPLESHLVEDLRKICAK